MKSTKSKFRGMFRARLQATHPNWERFQPASLIEQGKMPPAAPSCLTSKFGDCRWGAPLGRSLWAVLTCVVSAASACGPALKSRQPATEATLAATSRQEQARAVPLEKSREASGVFLLDGKPMCFLGTNNYYLIYKPSKMVDDVLDTAKAMGVKVFRHWAFTDRGSLDGSVPAVDGDGTKEGVYFQYWDVAAQKPAYNDGETGLDRLDYLLYKARQNGIRIVMVLTNNWRDFGGMDQYLTWYRLSKHHEFYTDERVKQAFKDYVAHLANRVNKFTGIAYKDDPFIFSWGLANEPRMRNYAAYDSREGWTPETVTGWAKEMSDYIRSIDPNHLISVGDEGFYAEGTGALYSGEDGVNHDALLALDNIDYGTFHLYPDHWGRDLAWGDQWIEDHLVSARRVGKPAVLEEYNVAVKRDDTTQEIVAGGERRAKTLSRWHQLVQLRGGSGAMFWMLAGYDDSRRGYYRDYDHFSVYSPRIDVTGTMMHAFGARMSGQAQACERATVEPSLQAPLRQVPNGFVTTSRPEAVLQLNARSLAAAQR